jgi:syndecan 1
MTTQNGEYGISPRVAQKVLTTSVDECAVYCAGQPGGSTLYLTLGASPINGDSICTCGNTLTARSYVHLGLAVYCSSPCKVSETPDVGVAYCGGFFGGSGLVSVFGAI